MTNWTNSGVVRGKLVAGVHYSIYVTLLDALSRPAPLALHRIKWYNKAFKSLPLRCCKHPGARISLLRRPIVSDNTSIPSGYKRCINGDKCIHPDGPLLPRDAEHFYMSKGTPSARCKPCAKAYRREHHQNNKEHDNARSRQYAQEHKGQYDLYRASYYARKRAAGMPITPWQLDDIYKAQHGCCHWCGEFVGLTFEIDHVIPLSRGGVDDPSNIVVCCKTCNRSKGYKLPEEWEEQKR
jgi:5-methylcytosine-specific restriction endonuclease McrA